MLLFFFHCIFDFFRCAFIAFLRLLSQSAFPYLSLIPVKIGVDDQFVFKIAMFKLGQKIIFDS